jgi:lysozyme
MTRDDIKRIAQFSAEFSKLGLKHFQPHEFLNLGGGHYGSGAASGLNTLPPRKYWKEIFKVARVWDQVRAALGSPIETLSVYRSPEYNRAVGGASQSYHMQGMACDATALKADAMELYNVAWQLREDGVFKGGIGLYTGSNFVHIDVRGKNVSWGS